MDLSIPDMKVLRPLVHSSLQKCCLLVHRARRDVVVVYGATFAAEVSRSQHCEVLQK